MTYLLIVEKPSAAKNFAAALGGPAGSFEGQSYKIQTLYGHMLEFVEPHEMVDASEADQFKSWSPETMPWDASRMSWQKRAQVTKNMKTGKKQSKQDGINAVKKAAQGCDAIVIATDKDPSGEGQLIGWEVIQAIGWRGKVKRLYFTDESPKKLQQGFRDIVDLPAYNQDGEYLKSDVRSRWDFLSMQLTRLATDAARKKGYDVKVVRQGRLKSVMTKLVADQLARVKAYKKVPYFEVKYKDDKGNTFSRKYEDGDAWRFAAKAEGEKDAANYGTGTVTVDSTTRKKTAPGKLLDLGGLTAILGTKGFTAKEILATYQKMYEAKIVSYPRTEDKVISVEQFNEMVPLVDKIAAVVGADTKLLTHRSARPTHVKDGGAHGANRPGVVVPSSLGNLAQYGKSAEAIYTLLAKNFLAMFGEDYVYDAVKAHIQEHPAFTASISVPVDAGFKAIFDADNESKDEGDDDENASSSGFGSQAKAIVSEGVNKKPPHPTHKWLEAQLSKYDVGTGATRSGTFSEITSGATALLESKRGKLGLTHTGAVAAALLEGSKIGDPVVTEQLFKSMKEVGALKLAPNEVLKTATDVVRHDKRVFYVNAEKLAQTVGAPTGVAQKEKFTGVFGPSGREVTFNREWGGYRFTDEDLQLLLSGKNLTFSAKTKKGSLMKVVGNLREFDYKGKTYFGFQRLDASDLTQESAPVPDVWSGHRFTSDEQAKLRRGETFSIEAVSAKTGKPFTCNVTFGLSEYKGEKRWGITPTFPDANDFTRADCSFNATFGGYTLTPAEIKQVRAGHKVMIKATSAKTKKKYSCNVSLEKEEYNGRTSWKLKPHFDK